MEMNYKITVFLDCADRDTGLRIRDLIDSLLEKNLDGRLVKVAKTVFEKVKK